MRSNVWFGTNISNEKLRVFWKYVIEDSHIVGLLCAPGRKANVERSPQ